jgi:S1-C subfamily serine protease
MFDLLDGILLIAVILFAVSGYRQGFVVGALSFVGFLGGGVLGAHVATPIADLIGVRDNGALVGILVVLILAMLGQVGATALGAALRDRLTWRAGQTVDSVLGAVLSGLSVLLVAWLLATAVDRSPFQSLSREVHNSAVLTTVDSAMPSPVRNAFTDLRQLVNDNGFPQVFAGLGGGHIVSVAAPDPAVLSAPGPQEAASSIVKIQGVAESCSRQVEGSGFVYASRRVMTNAHVLAGVTNPVVEAGGHTYPARTVLFDPERDIAVLYVPGLELAPLQFAQPSGQANDEAVVAGYPENGPYTTAAARIRNELNARAPDIYSRGTVVRDIYAIRAVVRPGNSGGPLLSRTGSVYGVVFAAATDDADTGYALTADEVDASADAARTATQRVATQGCD